MQLLLNSVAESLIRIDECGQSICTAQRLVLAEAADDDRRGGSLELLSSTVTKNSSSGAGKGVELYDGAIFAATNSVIAFLACPSFQDGRGSAPAPGATKASKTATIESNRNVR